MTCPSLVTVAAWTLGELTQEEESAFEEHYFACDACGARASEMQRLTAALRASLPPILTPARRQSLEGSRPSLRAVEVHPGGRASIRLGASAEVGIWVMHAPLTDATRVDIEARGPDGALVFSLADVPFDAQRGEVVLACQVHYQQLDLAKEMHVQLTTVGAGGRRAVGSYVLDHEFDSV